MKFRVVHQPAPGHARSPFRVVEQTTGREVDWINRYLDREVLRRVADITLSSYAYELLHFLRWWEVFTTPIRLFQARSQNQPCWTMCDSSPPNNLRSPALPSITALPL